MTEVSTRTPFIQCHRVCCDNPLTWENHRNGQLACDACMEAKLKVMILRLASMAGPQVVAKADALFDRVEARNA